MSKKIYIYGYYGFSNFGDDLLALSVVRAIFLNFPDAEVWIRNFKAIPALDQSGYRIYYTGIEKISIDQTIPKLKRALLYFSTLWSQLKGADYFVLGGGNLHDDREARFATFLLLVICILAKLRGAKLVGLGLGVGRMTTRLGKILLFLNFNLLDFISIRDVLGIRECKKAGVFRKIRLISDLAYSLPQEFIAKRRDQNFLRTVGVSLVGYLFDTPWMNNPSSPQYKMYYSILNIVPDLYKSGTQMVLLSFQTLNLPNGIEFGDRKVLEQLQHDILKKYQIKVPIKDCLATETGIQETLGSLSMYVGGRFHGFVVGAANGIPMVGISHDHKVREICRLFKMPWINIEEVSLDWLKQTIFEKPIQPPSQKTLARVRGAVERRINEAFQASSI